MSAVLRALLGDAVESGPVVAVAEGISPLESLPRPALASEVSYVDGVSGGNVFAVTSLGARKLAALMLGQSPDEVEDGAVDLSELELSALGEAANQMMAAAAAASSSVLQLEVEISTPTTAPLADGDDRGRQHAGARATAASFTICGEPCRLVQWVPHSFVVRVLHAYEELVDSPEGDRVVAGDGAALDPDLLLRVPLRIAAELGRVRLPLGTLIDLDPGALIELDRLVDEPVDVVLNGRRFGKGALVLDDNDEWAVRLEAVGPEHAEEGD